MPDRGLRFVDTGAAELGAALLRAIDRDELAVLYQPIVAVRTGRPVRLEALMRWNRPGVRMLTPANFISAAEQTGAIIALGHWILRRAISDCVQWQQDAPGVGVSINLSAKQLRDPNLGDAIDDVMHGASLPFELLEVDVKQSGLTDPSVDRLLRRLRGRGASVALDDFNGEPSPLAALNAPLDRVKIDAPVVASLENTQGESTVISTIFSAARAYSLEVIAEGVDSTYKLDRLRRIGCEFAQGFIFGEPGSIAHALSTLAT